MRFWHTRRDADGHARLGHQPLRLLGRRRRFGQALHFAQNLIPDSPGLIRVGDPVEIR